MENYEVVRKRILFLERRCISAMVMVPILLIVIKSIIVDFRSNISFRGLIGFLRKILTPKSRAEKEKIQGPPNLLRIIIIS